MKKLFFVKEFPIHGDTGNLNIRAITTIEVDFVRIEHDLPPGSKIRHETVQTVIEGGSLVVFGEYASIAAATEEIVAREAIDIAQVLGDQETLPSVN